MRANGQSVNILSALFLSFFFWCVCVCRLVQYRTTRLPSLGYSPFLIHFYWHADLWASAIIPVVHDKAFLQFSSDSVSFYSTVFYISFLPFSSPFLSEWWLSFPLWWSEERVSSRSPRKSMAKSTCCCRSAKVIAQLKRAAETAEIAIGLTVVFFGCIAEERPQVSVPRSYCASRCLPSCHKTLVKKRSLASCRKIYRFGSATNP